MRDEAALSAGRQEEKDSVVITGKLTPPVLIDWLYQQHLNRKPLTEMNWNFICLILGVGKARVALSYVNRSINLQGGNGEFY